MNDIQLNTSETGSWCSTVMNNDGDLKWLRNEGDSHLLSLP